MGSPELAGGFGHLPSDGWPGADRAGGLGCGHTRRPGCVPAPSPRGSGRGVPPGMDTALAGLSSPFHPLPSLSLRFFCLVSWSPGPALLSPPGLRGFSAGGSGGCLGWAESPPRAGSPQHQGRPIPRLPPPEAGSPLRGPALTQPTNQLCLEARGFTAVIFCCSFKSWGNSRPPPCAGLGWEGCRPLLLLAPSSQKPAMDSKDEVSDTDSGIILHSGEWFRPPSPRAPEPPMPAFPKSTSPGLWAPRVAGQTPGGLEGLPCWGSGREHGSCLGKYLQCSPLAPRSLRSWKILSGWGEGLRLWSV